MEVAHVGVRKRAQALAMPDAAAASSGPAKRRKVGGGELEISSPLIQIRSRSRGTPENSDSPAPSENSGHRKISKYPFSSPISDRVPASCCSSNASTVLAKERLKIGDLEDDGVQIEASWTCNFDNRSRRETTPSSELQSESGELDSTPSPIEANSLCRLLATKAPLETELDEFFIAAEKDLQKRFTEKYNYDIVKDVPLEGRYEWVSLKP
ncbi:Cyclin-dependent kinase [Actinidia chinensis var. chinensis]|uniref:Cyclin-dependent kinase n=1 Tax=Actinidia chinensis var. chinensis TaxID=1590841 RepID=A0A2R6R5L0_ACTCC|nr:Cyclin-dependent kinase [Actinidia chinensis var. chinensis]